MQVVERLQAEYGKMYSNANVMLSGTHTHSGPGGFLQYLLFDITSLGFIKETLDAMVEGIFQVREKERKKKKKREREIGREILDTFNKEQVFLNHSLLSH